MDLAQLLAAAKSFQREPMIEHNPNSENPLEIFKLNREALADVAAGMTFEPVGLMGATRKVSGNILKPNIAKRILEEHGFSWDDYLKNRMRAVKGGKGEWIEGSTNIEDQYGVPLKKLFQWMGY